MVKVIPLCALALALSMGGCASPRDQQAGGGGGAAVSPVEQTRDRMSEAYVAMARVHADVVRGDFDGASAAMKASRGALARAKQTARLDTQARINELDQAAIAAQRQIDGHAVDAYQTTGQLVSRMQTAFVAAARPSGGGGGPVPAASPTPADRWVPLEPQPNGLGH
jgi:hypothetical protein